MKLIAKPVLTAGAVLGEGSIWDHLKNLLYWVDILGQKVNIYNPKTAENISFRVGQDVGTVVPWDSRFLMIAVSDGFARLDTETGEVNTIVKKEAKGIRFNDGKCDPAGRFWAGTMAYDLEEGSGALYSLNTDFSVKKRLDNVTISNGLAWTKDHKIFYYIDSPTCQVDAFDYDINTGNIGNRRTVISVDQELGFPDGMTIDGEGMLWIAHYGGGRVTRWNPKKGNMLATIEIPSAKLVTSCAFGGINLDELYITTASVDLNEQDLMKQNLAGSLFKIKLDVTGIPAFNFKG
jgi:sugar lactone lactonase YvrE